MFQLSEFGQTVMDVVGWTLIHFVWQGILVGALAMLLLLFIPPKQSSYRYSILVGGLLLLFACPLITSIRLWSTDSMQRDFTSSGDRRSSVVADSNLNPTVNDNHDQISHVAQGQLAENRKLDPVVEDVLGWLKVDRWADYFQSQMAWIVLAWMGGTFVLTGRFTLGVLQISHWRRDAQTIKDSRLHSRFQVVKERVGLSRNVGFFHTDRLEVPIVMGWFQPLVIVPTSLLSGLTPMELEAILAHELVHLRRHDHWINLLQVIAETVLFYHPAVWWVSGQLRIEREFCCDQAVIELNSDRAALAHALSKLEEHRMAFYRQSLASNGGTLLARIRRLAGCESAKTRWGAIYGVVPFAVLFVISFCVYSVNAVEIPSDKPSASFHSTFNVPSKEASGESKRDSRTPTKSTSDLSTSVQAEVSKTPDQEENLPQVIATTKDGQTIQEAYVAAVVEGRTATDLLKHFSMHLQQFGSPQQAGWVTNMESIVSAYPSKAAGSRMEAEEVLFNLPEGSATRGVFKGQSIEIEEGSESKTIRILDGSVELFDSIGVRRAKAVSRNGKLLFVDCRYDRNEVVLTIRTTEKQDGNAGRKSRLGIDMNTETGAAADEEDPPHGAIRYAIFEQDSNEEKPLRMKMQWRYEFSRLAREAEAESGLRWEELIFGKQEDEEVDPGGEDQKIHQKKPWIVNGRVTNADGRPMKGVTVKAHAGVGTLRQTGSDKTDENGNYEFRFGPGIWMQGGDGVQAATISVSLPGYFEKNLHRQGDLVAAHKRPVGEIGWGGKTEEHLFLPNKPKTIDFVMMRATSMRGTILKPDGKPASGFQISLTGGELPPSSSVVANTRTDAEGRFELGDLPTGYAYQILVSPPKAKSPWLAWALPPMTFRPSATEESTNLMFVNNGHEETIETKQILLLLKGDGINWKQALKTTVRQNLVFDFAAESGVAEFALDMGIRNDQ